MAKQIFTAQVIEVVRAIPKGKVATYGGIAALAGNSRGARQVVRVLHIYSAKENLPWQRVVNREGCISLKPGHGYEEQKELLDQEGIEFDLSNRIDLEKYLWIP
ncbi:MGMT family protein [Maridesulfovibrio zosterae]|uniref:MGMT family protein n=1 Tax=Maridesulfovibrio zosterae TaxID=82171 RepID=UPI000484E10C|nr:MGMT family protein [Maridesulfovibrio zosterae]